MASGKWCPLIQDCEHKCAFYTHVMGQSYTGQAVDEWACSIQFLPKLLIENLNNKEELVLLLSIQKQTKATQSNINILEAAAKCPCISSGSNYR